MQRNPDTTEYQRLQSILESAVDAIITISENGVVLSVNPAMKQLFQYEDSEVIGQNVSMLMPSPHREQHDGYMKKYLDTGIAKIIGVGREVIGQRKDGSTFPVHLAISEMNANGRRFFTGFVRDISDLKKAQRQLTELNAELEKRIAERTCELEAAQVELVTREKLATLGQLSGNIAHEIRNPLNAVRTSAYFLLHAENVSDEKRREHLERIDRQVSMINNVVTALTDVAKLPEPQKTEVCCTAMLASVLRDVKIPNNISISLDLPDDLPLAMVDALQIPIVFRNLLRNACDAMPDGGNITIHGDSSKGALRLHVDDTGEGIDSELLSKIIEPLYSTKARGMGLGLAICNTILKKNDGKLLVDSQPGNGSRFTVELSAAAD